MSTPVYVVAGTPSAAEHGIGELGQCARCGAPLRHCWVTESGVFGGDCLATITGDPVSRALVRRIVAAIARIPAHAVVRLRVEEQRRVVADLRVGWDEWRGLPITRQHVVHAAAKPSMAYALAASAACGEYQGEHDAICI